MCGSYSGFCIPLPLSCQAADGLYVLITGLCVAACSVISAAPFGTSPPLQPPRLRPASAVSPRPPRLRELLFSCVWEIYPDNVLTRTFTAGYDLRMDVACLLLLAWAGACTTKFGGIKLRHIIVLLTAGPPGGTLRGHTQTKGFLHVTQNAGFSRAVVIYYLLNYLSRPACVLWGSVTLLSLILSGQ